MSKPVVSVIIDTYNHERFIAQAIESVLEQGLSPEDMEIIVVDDGSTDETPLLVRKFGPRVRHLYKPNGGQASAFNAGLREARGELVAMLDGDDWWAPRKLRTVVEVLEKNAEVGAVGHGFYEVHPDGQPDRVVVPEQSYRLKLDDLASARLFSYLRTFLGTSRMTIRKEVLDRILPVPEQLVIEADEYVFTLAPAIAPVIVLDQPLFCYRLHTGNLYQMHSDDTTKLRRKQQVMACLVRELPPRLASLGVPPEAVEAVIEPIWADAESLRLGLDGGKPWETFRVEHTKFHLAYKQAGLGYRLFKAGVLGLALMLPPQRFYRLKEWYSARGLRRLRRVVGEPVPAAPIVERR